jgi:predicted transcriptional regulator
MSKWTFLTNHATVLVYLARKPSITARELAFEIGITERAVRGIIADLQSEGYIVKTREGRRVRYGINKQQPMRRPSFQHKQVGDLLDILSWKRKLV